MTMCRSSICIWVVGSASAIGIACLAALVVGGLAALRAAEAAGQDAADSPSFEARILTLNVSGPGPFAIVPGPGRLRGTNIPARFLTGAAFADPGQGPLHTYRIIGGSGWLNTARFDLDARVPESVRSAYSGRRRWLFALLRTFVLERFTMTVRLEERELPPRPGAC